MAWGGTQVERFHVLAHRGTRDGDVVIVSPQNEEPCSLGKLDGYLALQPANSGKYVLGSPSPARIGLFDQLDEDGVGRVRFAGVDCKRIALEVDGVDPNDVRRLHPKDLTELSLIMPTRDGTLLLVNPWAGKKYVIAKDVRSVRTSAEGVWLIEGGRAVQRDLEGVEQARYGENVTEILPLSDAGDLVFVDDRGIVQRRHGEQKLLDADGCRIRSMGSFIPQALGWFSPCDSQRLVVRTVDGEEHRYEQAISSMFAQDGRLLFTVDEESTTQLWMVSPADLDEPILLSEMPTFDLQTVWRVSGTAFRLAVRQSDGTLSLLYIDAAQAPQKAKTLLDRAVALSTYEGGIVVVKEDKTLLLLRRSDLGVLLRQKNVARSGFRFVFGGEATAVAYVHDADPETGLGDLALRFLTGEHFEIAENVREFREVWWPESGLLYTTGGARAAIRFAHVDVPCEKTSDSPWACGF